MKESRHPMPYLFFLSVGILAMANCGASQSNEVVIDSVVPPDISIVAANTTAYSEIEIVGKVISAAEATEGDPVADAEVIISIPYNGVFPVTENANAFLVYDAIDSSVRTQITGNYFTATTDSSGIFRFAVSVPVGGEYTTNLYFIVGNNTLSYPISVAVE
jgi:hypothetical protein